MQHCSVKPTRACENTQGQVENSPGSTGQCACGTASCDASTGFYCRKDYPREPYKLGKCSGPPCDRDKWQSVAGGDFNLGVDGCVVTSTEITIASGAKVTVRGDPSLPHPKIVGDGTHHRFFRVKGVLTLVHIHVDGSRDTLVEDYYRSYHYYGMTPFNGGIFFVGEGTVLEDGTVMSAKDVLCGQHCLLDSCTYQQKVDMPCMGTGILKATDSIISCVFFFLLPYFYRLSVPG